MLDATFLSLAGVNSRNHSPLLNIISETDTAHFERISKYIKPLLSRLKLLLEFRNTD